jgi:alkylhydroperoxidase family enzyme
MAVRTTAVRGAIASKEAACNKHQPQAGDDLTQREALAVSFAERIALDPHTVDTEFFEEIKHEFSKEEIVEIVFACGIFNWGNKFNITLHMDSDEASEYDSDMEYREEKVA